MDIVIGLVVLFAIGWVISKSKVLSAILNAVGLAFNIFWGVAFIGVAVWGMIDGDMGLWTILLLLGVGVYFLWPSRGRGRRNAQAEVASSFSAPSQVEAGTSETD